MLSEEIHAVSETEHRSRRWASVGGDLNPTTRILNRHDATEGRSHRAPNQGIGPGTTAP